MAGGGEVRWPEVLMLLIRFGTVGIGCYLCTLVCLEIGVSQSVETIPSIQLNDGATFDRTRSERFGLLPSSGTL